MKCVDTIQFGRAMSEIHDPSTPDEEEIAVFWTGGWDSTTRVVDLVVHYGCPVQPIYVIDRSRRSWSIEVERMERIRDHLSTKYPERAHLLLPTNFIDRSELETSDLVNHPYLKLASKTGTSTQYAYLSKVSEITGYPKIEVAIHSEDDASTYEVLRERVKEVRLECGATTYEMDPWEPSTQMEHAMKVFETYRLPYMFTHPDKLASMTADHGLNSLLSLTFTCRIPLRGEPCGVCETCRYAIRSGKTDHFPSSALLRYRFSPILTPVWIMIVNPKGGMKQIARKLRILS